MKNNTDKIPFCAKFLVLLHIILGIGAVAGGAVLIISPDGGIMKMPVSMLEHSPFNNYLIPGIILLVVIGLLPLVVASALIKKWQFNLANKLNVFKDMHWSWTYSLYIGFVLIIWIIVEAYFIQTVAFLHLAYTFLGLIIQAVTLLPSVQKHYRRS